MLYGYSAFDKEFCDMIGGYPDGCILRSRIGSVLWCSRVDDNTVDPDDGRSDNWNPYHSTEREQR